MQLRKRSLVFVFLLVPLVANLSKGQELPVNPVSSRIFTPFIFNPAIAGSKDYSSADLLISSYGKSTAGMASTNLRLATSRKDYFSSLESPEFSNIGVGGYLFNEKNDISRNIGFGATASYHLPMDRNELSFLSFGITAKAIYNDYAGNTDLGLPAETTLFPNVDAGVYYYSSNLFAGISATNLLGNPIKPDSTGFSIIPVSRQLYLQAGYKLLLSRRYNIVLEPSVIINTDVSFSGEIIDMIKPGLKLYAGNFCAGTYFNDFDKISFFLQYKYSKMYLASYFELPYNTPYYKQPILAELAVGINLSAVRSGITRRNHW
jgi:type IX secretion system PorP/SprF family membrane protein